MWLIQTSSCHFHLAGNTLLLKKKGAAVASCCCCFCHTLKPVSVAPPLYPLKVLIGLLTFWWTREWFRLKLLRYFLMCFAHIAALEPGCSVTFFLLFIYLFFTSLSCSVFFSPLSYIMQWMLMYTSTSCMGSEGLVCFDRSESQPGCTVNNWLLRCYKSCKQSRT